MVPTARILHISKSWLPQTQTWIFTQIKHLSPNIECHIFCERTENLNQFNFPAIHVFNRQTVGLRNFFERSLRVLRLQPHLSSMASAAKRLNPAVVHSHFGYYAWGDIHIARHCAARHVTTFYGFDVNKLPLQSRTWRKRYRELFSAGDRFLCEGSHMAACLEKLGCPADKIRVHHLGIDLHHFPFLPRVYQEGETLKVLMAASFNEKKGLVYGIEALGAVRRDIPLSLTIIGDAPKTREGSEQKRRIFQSIKNSRMTDCTQLQGYQAYAKLIEEAYRHHIFLAPSVTASDGDTEGGAPVSIIEMAASGMPVVSTHHCDIPEVLGYGDENLLARERDVLGLSEIIRKWINTPDLWEERLASARHHIESEYCATTQGKRLSQIYRELAF